jgi:hypothetical protein
MSKDSGTTVAGDETEVKMHLNGMQRSAAIVHHTAHDKVPS